MQPAPVSDIETPSDASPERSARVRRLVLEGLLIVALSVIAVMAQVRWAQRYHGPPDADYAMQVAEASGFDAVMRAPGPLLEKACLLWAWPANYADLVYATSSACAPFTGRSVTGLLASLALYLPLLVLGAYLLGRAVGGPALGGLAAVLVTTDTRVVHTCRSYWLDLPLCALTLLTLAALAHTDGLRRLRQSLLFGVLLGFSMLVKYTAAWLCAAPACVLTLWGVWRERPPVQRFARFAVLALAAALALRWLSAVSRAEGLYQLTAPQMAPLLSFELAYGCAAVCALWAAAAWFALDGVLLHATLACAVALLIAGPWGVVNSFAVVERWRGMESGLAALAQHMGEELPSQIWNISRVTLVLGGLGALAAIFWKERRPVLLPLLLALLVGGWLTVTRIGSAHRYLAPLGALFGVLAVGAVPRRGWVAWPVFVASLALPALVLFNEPLVVPSNTPEPVRAFLGAFVSDEVARTVPDLERVARGVSGALGASRTVTVIGLEGASEEVRNDLYYMIATVENWSGAPRAVRLLAWPELQSIELLPMQNPRARQIAAWRGETRLDVYRFEAATDAPDALVLLGAPAEARRAVERFSRVYSRVSLDENDLTVWVAQPADAAVSP